MYAKEHNPRVPQNPPPPRPTPRELAVARELAAALAAFEGRVPS